MLKIEKFFKKSVIKKWFPVVFYILWFLFFVILSLFRDAKLDENIYLGESTVIADLLKQGKWIGNYGVGLHGFISKLLVGTVFIFSGPSVFIATLLNILMGVFSGVVFYRILTKHFRLSIYFSLFGVTLLFCSYQFITYIPTFYRDIGVLLCVLLTIDSVLGKKSKWITGIFLLLVLDSKEHVFYTLAPAFIIWIAIESWQMYKGTSLIKVLKNFIVSGFQLFLPSLIYLILMFTTAVIPLNIYNAKILGLIDEGFKTLIVNFDPAIATINRDIAANPDIAKTIPTVTYSQGSPGLFRTAIDSVNLILSYIGKISYPRTFSFLSVPFLIVIPSLSTCVLYFRKWLKKKQYEKLLLPISLFIYLIIYIVHASISRYILPISPLLFVFFVLFLKNINGWSKGYYKLLWITVGFVFLELFFEYSFVWVKIIFSVLILVILFLIFITKNSWRYLLTVGFIVLVSFFTLGTSIIASYQYGQIGSYLKYGYNRECKEIMSLVDKNDNIWINDIGWDRLPFVLRSENVQDPEWKWNLQEWMPKNDMLVIEDSFLTNYFYWEREAGLKGSVDSKKIEKIVYIDLINDFEDESLLMQNRADMVLDFDWLEHEKNVIMKNKKVYVFNVIDSK